MQPGTKSINLFKASAGIQGERRYLIYAGWWRKWLDFTNFDYDQKHRSTSRKVGSGKGSKKAADPKSKNETQFRDELLLLKQQKLTEKSLDRS